MSTDIKAKNWDTNFEWMGVLSVAPACIQLLAMCAAVAARPEASGLELYHNPDFQYLRKLVGFPISQRII